MQPGIFAKGEFIDGPEECNMANTGKTVCWVAVRGDIYDWTIYSQNPHYIDSDDLDVIALGYGGVWDWEKIRKVGDKIHSEQSIRKLVDCDDEALKMYRH